MSISEVSKDIKIGRRAIDGLDFCHLLSSFQWRDDVKKWHIKIRMKCVGSSLVPPDSDWDLLFDNSYPWGEIKFFPNKSNSVEATFPHQAFNFPGLERFPWRSGAPCLDTENASLNRAGIDDEPTTASGRMLWHIQRLKIWLELASKNLLLSPGDPFELPVFPIIEKIDCRIIFNEDVDSFSFWASEIGNSGACRLFSHRRNWEGTRREKLFFVHSFTSQTGSTKTLSWGSNISKCFSEKHSVIAPWVLLNDIPILFAWQVPQKWSELKEVCASQGIDLEGILYSYIEDLREQYKRLILVGVPIPKTVGDKACQIHWQAIEIPFLSSKDNIPNGFRNNDLGRQARDARDLRVIQKNTCDWVASENWSKLEITTRGVLPITIQKLKFSMIGCGALGSYLTEGLVRSGVEKIVVSDSDILGIGNLTRHTLTIEDVGAFKTTQLSEKLSKISPHSVIEIVDGGFPVKNERNIKVIKSADIIIDCTGSDKLLFDLANFNWGQEKVFFFFFFRHEWQTDVFIFHKVFEFSF